MLYTTRQVAERLGVSQREALRMAKFGVLPPVNEPKEGSKKFFPRWDSKVVEEYRRAQKAEGRGPKRASRNGAGAHPPVHVGEGPTGSAVGSPSFSPMALSARLKAIEEKLDLLLRLWS